MRKASGWGSRPRKLRSITSASWNQGIMFIKWVNRIQCLSWAEFGFNWWGGQTRYDPVQGGAKQMIKYSLSWCYDWRQKPAHSNIEMFPCMGGCDPLAPNKIIGSLSGAKPLINSAHGVSIVCYSTKVYWRFERNIRTTPCPAQTTGRR